MKVRIESGEKYPHIFGIQTQNEFDTEWAWAVEKDPAWHSQLLDDFESSSTEMTEEQITKIRELLEKRNTAEKELQDYLRKIP